MMTCLYLSKLLWERRSQRVIVFQHTFSRGFLRFFQAKAVDRRGHNYYDVRAFHSRDLNPYPANVENMVSF